MEKLTSVVKSYSFNPETSKSQFVVPCKDEYCAKQYLSVSVRLNFEYKNCIDNNGIVYFVTFTYNDNGCFHFGRFNYFDNNHIRKFFNKSIFPSRLQSNGYSFRFALFGETGDGKGVRGIDNNPHYHVLIFLYPSGNCNGFYHCETNFLKLCKQSWNQDLSDLSVKKYRELNVGNVSFSDKGARVLDSSCFNYCASYCIKTLSVSPYNERVKSSMAYVSYSNLLRVLRCFPDGSLLNDFLIEDDKVLGVYKDFVVKYFKRLPQLCTFNRKYDDYLLILKDSVLECLSIELGFTDLSFIDLFTSDNDFFISPFYHKVLETSLFQSFYHYLVNRFKCVYRLSPNLGSLGFDYINSRYMLDVSMFTCFSSPRINLPSYYFRKLFFTPQKHGTGYVYLSNDKYNDFCKIRYSKLKFHSSLMTFKSNKNQFISSLTDQLKESISKISDIQFVAYFGFRGFSFNINSLPDIDSIDCWKYLRCLDFSSHHLYSVPRSLQDFRDEYLSFALHPFFYHCPDIDKLSRLYDEFMSCNYSSKRIRDTSDYFKLSSINGKDYKVY